MWQKTCFYNEFSIHFNTFLSLKVWIQLASDIRLNISVHRVDWIHHVAKMCRPYIRMRSSDPDKSWATWIFFPTIAPDFSRIAWYSRPAVRIARSLNITRLHWIRKMCSSVELVRTFDRMQNVALVRTQKRVVRVLLALIHHRVLHSPFKCGCRAFCFGFIPLCVNCSV